MKLIITTILGCIILLNNQSFAQNNYFTESFESTAISGNQSGAPTTPTDITLPSGVWKMYYVYRGSTGTCAGKPLRFLSTATAGLSGPTYAITPTLPNGVGQLFFVENSAAIRTIAIFKSSDNGANFTLLQNVTTLGATCDTTLLTINDATINKLKFVNETTSNLGLDNMSISKANTLLDGTATSGGGGIVVTDTLPYYPDVVGKLPAFPGAEGAGKYTRGGRGGAVVEVTNLLDDAAGNIVGSFRWAQKQNPAGGKTIVFKVSGTIHLVDALSFARGDVTIAGQTAPGDGICIADYPITIGKKNVIMRYLRFRLGDIGIKRTNYASSAGDAINSSGGTNSDSIIIDHCTTSWSIDEAASFKNMTHFTLQNCLISEPLNESDHVGELHGYGGIWGGVNATFHHNLFVSNSSRNCRFNGSRQYSAGEKDTVDYRNNVIYNWGINTVNGGEGGFYNIVNNYYKPGPSTNASVYSRIFNPYKDATLPYPKAYITGNIMTSSASITANNWLGVKMEDGVTALVDTGLSKVDRQIKTYRTTTHTADEAYTFVLKNAGAIMPKRDTLDQRIVNDVINGTGRVIDVQGGFPAATDTSLTKGAWPTLLSREAAADNDKDGMPNEWETQRGLNFSLASDRNSISPNGYTNLENYLNGDSIVGQGVLETCIPVPPIFASNSNVWLNLKDTNYIKLISTDTMNVIAAIKDAGNYGSFAASYYTTNTTRMYNGKALLKRSISIVPNNPSNILGTVAVRFYFSKAEFDALKIANTSISSLSDLRVLKVADNFCPTELQGTVTEIIPTSSGTFGTYNNGYFVEFNTSSFSTFFIGSTLGVVPVKLLTFNGKNNKENIQLNWSTASEINTKHFEIQKSNNAINFEKIGIVNAKGFNSNIENYNFIDNNLFAQKIFFYRLKIIDNNAKFNYSNVLRFEVNADNKISVFPNPANKEIVVSHATASFGTLLKIYSVEGKLLLSKTLPVGSSQNMIDVNVLKKANYLLVIENAGKKVSVGFVKE